MKICLVSQEYPPETGGGGIGTQTYLKAHGLTARGHEVHVVSTTWTPEERVYMDRLATIHRIPQPPLTVAGNEPSSLWLAYSATVAKRIIDLDKKVGFDVMQFPEYAGEGLIYQTDTFHHPRRAKYVLQMHGPLGMFVERMGWPDKGSTLAQIGCFMERTVIHHSDRLLASSHCSAEFCANAYGAPLGEIRVIHSAVNTTRFSPRPSSGGDPHPRVLFVGNLAGNKGLGSLVNAVLELRGKFPGIRLRAIGKGDKSYIEAMKKKIAAERGEAAIEIKGYVPYQELPDQYAWCDFFAGPSVYEPGPGNVYLEAMASGRPVIACNTGGAPEVVLHDKTGLLVPPSDVELLAEAIATLAEDDALRERLGRAGRERIEGNFSFEKYVDKVETQYKELVP